MKHKLIVSILIIFVLFSSVVTAWDFDNVKHFDKDNGKYGKISIINSFGLGSTLAEYELLTNTDQCLINCEATGTAKLYNSGTLFEDVNFYDSFDDSKQMTSSQFYILTEFETDLITPKYKEVCSETTNGTICIQENYKNTTTKVTNYEWVEYDYETLDKGTYDWKLVATKRIDQNIDWIAESQGVEFSEWAWWDSSWTTKKELTVTGGSATLDNFTIYVEVGYEASMVANFSDIRFVDISETTELVYEMAWQNGTDAGFWVKVPTLAVGENTLFMYYANAVAPSTSNPVNAWDDYYYGVYHFEGNALDSKGNVDGTNVNSVGVTSTNCFSGQCYLFADSDSWIQLDSSFENMRNFSAEGWGYLTSNADYRNIIGQSGGGSDRTFALRVNSGTTEVEGGVYTSVGGYKYSRVDYAGVMNNLNYYAMAVGGNINAFSNETKGASMVFNDESDPSSNNAGIGAIYAGGIIQEWVGSIDEVRFSTITRSDAWLGRSYQNYNLTNVAFSGEMFASSVVTLNYPTTNLILSTTSVPFNCSAQSSYNLTNMTLYVDSVLNYTYVVNTKNATLLQTKTIAEGSHTWYCNATDTTGVAGTTTPLAFEVDTIAPTLSTANNISTLVVSSLPYTDRWNYTASDAHLRNCYYNTTENSTITLFTCNTTLTTEWNSNGRKTIWYYANDSTGRQTSATTRFDLFNYSYTINQNPTSILEGDSITYEFNLSMKGIYGNFSQTNATIKINGTDYVTSNFYSANRFRYVYTKTYSNDTGSVTGVNYLWNWTSNIKNSTTLFKTFTTTSDNTTIYSIDIDNCSVFGVQILNYTLVDEEYRSNLLPTALENQTIEIAVNLSSGTMSWSNSFEVNDTNNLQVCVPSGVLVGSNSITTDVIVRYGSGEHATEFNYIDNWAISNSSYFQNIYLYDLYSGSARAETSTLFLFTYYNEKYLPVEDAVIEIYRLYIPISTYLNVEEGKTDRGGLTNLHLVEDSVIYRAVVRVNGTAVYTYADFQPSCLSSPCTYTLWKRTTMPSFPDYETIENLNYQIVFDEGLRSVEATFSTTDSSSVNLSMFVWLYDGADLDTLVCSNEQVSSGSTLICGLPVSYGNATFIVDVYKDSSLVDTKYYVISRNPTDTFGADGALLAFLLIVTLVLMFATDGILVLVMTILGVIFAGLLLFIKTGNLIRTGSAVLWLIIGAGILIWKMRKNK